MPQFVEVELAKANQERGQARLDLGTTIEVRLRNGQSLLVAPEFDANHLREVLAVVSHARAARLHTLDPAPAARIWLAAEATEMCCGLIG